MVGVGLENIKYAQIWDFKGLLDTLIERHVMHLSEIHNYRC